MRLQVCARHTRSQRQRRAHQLDASRASGALPACRLSVHDAWARPGAGRFTVEAAAPRQELRHAFKQSCTIYSHNVNEPAPTPALQPLQPSQLPAPLHSSLNCPVRKSLFIFQRDTPRARGVSRDWPRSYPAAVPYGKVSTMRVLGSKRNPIVCPHECSCKTGDVNMFSRLSTKFCRHCRFLCVLMQSEPSLHAVL